MQLCSYAAMHPYCFNVSPLKMKYECEECLILMFNFKINAMALQLCITSPINLIKCWMHHSVPQVHMKNFHPFFFVSRYDKPSFDQNSWHFLMNIYKHHIFHPYFSAKHRSSCYADGELHVMLMSAWLNKTMAGAIQIQ